jgi:hypothetical protein
MSIEFRTYVNKIIFMINTCINFWIPGAEKFANQIKEMLGALPGIFWRMCWTYISPLFLGVSQSLKFLLKMEFRIFLNFFRISVHFFCRFIRIQTLTTWGLHLPELVDICWLAHNSFFVVLHTVLRYLPLYHN